MNTWQYMWRIFTYKPGLFALNVVGWTLFHTIPLTYGLFTKAIFDALSAGAAAGANAWTYLAFFAVAAASRTAVFVPSFRWFSALYMMIQALLRHNLLEYLMQAAGSREIPESPSEAVTRFRDDVNDVAEYLENWLDMLGLVGYGVAGLALLFVIDPLITLVACGPLFVMAVVMRRLGGLIRSYRRAFREATERVTGFIGETFTAVQAVKVAGKEAPVSERFDALGRARKRAALRDTLLREMIDTINTNLVNIGVGAVLILAAEQIRSGQFSVGDFALYVNILPRLTRVLTFTGRTMAQHKRTGVAFERMLRLLQDSPPENVVKHTPLYLEEPDASGNGVLPGHAEKDGAAVAHARASIATPPLQTLEVRGLTYHYPGSRSGVEDISFSLRRGDFVVITGRIGSGKTTLLRALLGLVPRECGEILWNGEIVEDPATFFTPPRAAYTAQSPRLFSETLKENIMLGEADERGLPQALELAVIAPDIAQLERGLDTLVGTRGVKLSGGQLQRAAAARMFMRRAELLVFDDLSSALDVQTEQILWESLFRERPATCLVVSHRRVALRRATRILVLDQGRLVAEGTPSEILGSAALRNLAL